MCLHVKSWKKLATHVHVCKMPLVDLKASFKISSFGNSASSTPINTIFKPTYPQIIRRNLEHRTFLMIYSLETFYIKLLSLLVLYCKSGDNLLESVVYFATDIFFKWIITLSLVIDLKLFENKLLNYVNGLDKSSVT